MPAWLIVEETDIPNRVATTKWQVTPQAVTPAFITAAQALITATFGAGLLSLAGVSEAYYEHDIITSPVAPGANTDVRKHWQITNQAPNADSERQQIGAPLTTANIAPGTFILAAMSSTAWTAYKAAVGASAFAWIGNEGETPMSVIGAVATARGRKAQRIKVTPAPHPQLGGHVVINCVDAEGRHARMRFRVTPQSGFAAWITAAQAVLTATYGASAISLAGYKRAYYKHDFLSSPITAQNGTLSTDKWQIRCKDVANNRFQIQLPMQNETSNLQGGDQQLADTGSANWLAFIAALQATNLQWIANEGGASPVIVGAKSINHARKNPRSDIR